MMVTKEMDYALRILRALQQQQQPLTAPQIAQLQHLPQAVTYKLLKMLSAQGIVKANRGKTGGYSLLVPCEEITLYTLFHMLEGPMLLTQCLEPGFSCENNSCGQCKAHREFARIQAVLDVELKAKTLAELF